MFTHTLVLLLPNEANRKIAQGVETEVLKRRFHLRRRFSSNEAKHERGNRIFSGATGTCFCTDRLCSTRRRRKQNTLQSTYSNFMFFLLPYRSHLNLILRIRSPLKSLVNH